MEKSLNAKILRATKWSSFTEILARLIVPLTTIILARILSPEAFGIIASIMLVITFTEMFADAGFQKYLVQHEFKTEREKFNNANVAFWTNISISLVLWLLITIFSEELAILVGNPGLGIIYIVAGISLPLTSFSSIQMSLYRRDFNYKTLFYVRIVGILLPFIITIPLALLGLNYWALIIGTIAGNISNALILTIFSKWKPQFFYSFKILKEMLSFSIWTLVESISIWLTTWGGIFIVGRVLSPYDLGIYTTSMNIVNGVMGIITGATTSILFSALSRLQSNEKEFNETFFKFQKVVGIFILPLSIGIFVYRDFITSVLLGGKWEDASLFIGVWGLTSGIMIVFGHYCSEIYRAKGKPKLSFIAQFLHLIVLIPALIYSVRIDFTTLIIVRSIVRVQLILVHFMLVYYFFKLSPWKMIKNVLFTLVAAILMGIVAWLLRQVSSLLIWEMVTILISTIFYFTILLLVPNNRKYLTSSYLKLKKKRS